MTILDIIKKSATLLNIRDILDDTNLPNMNADINENPNACTEAVVLANNAKIKQMLEIISVVVSEICTDYVEIKKEITLLSSDCKIMLSSLNNLVKVLKVACDHGKQKFKLYDDHILLDHEHEYKVLYSYLPDADSLVDSLDALLCKIGSETLVFGLSAYYCLSYGIFDEYEIYFEKYREKLQQYAKLKNFNLPARLWQ